VPTISDKELAKLHDELAPLIGLKLPWLSIPVSALAGFEPSQIAVIINTLADGALGQVDSLSSDAESKKKLSKVGLSKPKRQSFGEREAYPDYDHASGKRVELKGLFVDNPDLSLKRPPSRREPSARVKENITMKQVYEERDVLLVAAIQLKQTNGMCSPVIIDFALFPMADVVHARDQSLVDRGGKWAKDVPMVPTKESGVPKLKRKERLLDSDYEKDTNFGKLKRIPYSPLQEFMRKHGVLSAVRRKPRSLVPIS
jgi:hypothetical protein